MVETLRIGKGVRFPLRSGSYAVRRLASREVVRACSQETGSVREIKGFCYGCGAKIQIDDPQRIGFVPEDKFMLKAKFKQYDQLLCERCKSLSHGQMVPAVLDLHQKAMNDNTPGLISPDDFRSQLMIVRERAAVVVLLVDLLDLPGSFLNGIRDLVGRNPVVLIGTKLDLLPKGTRPRPVLDLLTGLADARRLTIAASHLVSSRTGKGIPQAVTSLIKNRRGRDVFVMGAANVGKSAFVRALLKDMRDFTSTNFSYTTKAKANYLPMESSMPGTTMGMIPLRAFDRGAMLYDTPGLHIFHRILHLLSPNEMASLHPRKSLSPYIAPSPLELTREVMTSNRSEAKLEEYEIGRGESDIVSGCYEWGGIARIELLEVPRSTKVVFYAPKVLKVKSKPLQSPTADDEEDVVDRSEVWKSLFSSSSGADSDFEDIREESIMSTDDQRNEAPEFGRASVELRGGLVLGKEFEVIASGIVSHIGDIAVSGVSGWCSLIVPSGGGLVRGRVFVPRGVQAYLRPHIPVPDPLQSNHID